MKKIGCLLMISLLMFGLFGCNKDNNEGESLGEVVPPIDEPSNPVTPDDPTLPPPTIVDPVTPTNPNGEREVSVDYENLTIYVPGERNMRVAQFADLHLSKESLGGYSNDKEKRTIDFMTKVVNDTDPDLIVLSGDNLFGKSAAVGMSGVKNLQRLIDIMESLKTPWMFVYGNHDSEELTANSSKKDLHEHLLNCDAKYLLYGDEYSEPNTEDYRDVRYGVYTVKLRDLDTKELTGAYIVLDNGYYDSRISSYNSITEGQINWYKNRISQLQNEYKGEGVVPTVVFSHIQVPEVYNAYISAFISKNPNDTGFANKYGADAFTDGEHEFVKYQDVRDIDSDSDWVEMIKIGAPLTNKTNFYDVMVELGSTKACFYGHAHNYYFQVKSNGIIFGFAPQTGFAPAESINWDPRMGHVYSFDANLNLDDTIVVNEDEKEVLGSGLAIKYMDATNGDDLFLTPQADANGNYVYTVTMLKQWARIKLFFNGELIEFKGANAYTIDGDFSPVYVTNGKLYNENGNSILYFSLKDVTKYKVTVNPNNKTVNIDKLGDEDLQEGCLIETRYNGTTDASVKTTKGELKDGVYTFTVKFEKKWGYVSLMYNGKYLDPTTTTFAGDIGGYGSTVLYFDSESPAHQLNCCQESGTYVITYNPTTNTVNVAYQG